MVRNGGVKVPGEDGMTASGHCGEDLGMEVTGEEVMTASGHCG